LRPRRVSFLSRARLAISSAPPDAGPLPAEPAVKRTFAYFDAQNLFNAAKEAFDEFEGYDYPSYDPIKLAQCVCRLQSWSLERIHFYTGIPEASDRRHDWWNRKLQVLGSRGVITFSRPLRYREEESYLPGGRASRVRVGREKGIDVRLALDVVRHALENLYDVALIFSQDQDLSEAVSEVALIGRQQGRWIKCSSAFPMGAASISPATGLKRNQLGIRGAKPIRIPKPLYDTCRDPTDYRMRLGGSS
jgi:uncharacterized LabA/DUF88 family protein